MQPYSTVHLFSLAGSGRCMHVFTLSTNHHMVYFPYYIMENQCCEFSEVSISETHTIYHVSDATHPYPGD